VDTIYSDAPEMPETMDEGELQALVQREAEDAAVFIEQELGPRRAHATKLYRGDPLGNEAEGRSQVVSRDVLDAVQSIIPSLMKVFFGAERAVEFVPHGPEDVEQAEQATDYINWLLLEQNRGFEVFHTVFKDSLIGGIGLVKFWRDESLEVDYAEFTGLSDPELGQVLQEPGTEIAEITSNPVGPPVMDAMASQSPPLLHDVLIKRIRRSPRIAVAAVPPEEFLIDRTASSLEDARYVGHRQLLSVNDLVALGYDREFVEGHVTHRDRFHSSEEVFARYSRQGGYWNDSGLNEEEASVLYVESWIHLDYDGDGLAELRKICTIGDSYEVVANEPASQRPFAAFTPDPEPHLFFGTGIGELVSDLQLINSNIKRSILDSLAQSIYPRTAIVEGRVNLADVLNTETGAIIRQDAPGMVTPFAMPFVGKEAVGILELMEGEKDRRVGTHNLAMSGDELQSTTRAAVTAQVQAATQRLELISRLYAESGFTRLFKGLLRLVVTHADKKEVARLRQKWVEVDPASWNASMDCTVNVGLGNGLQDERVAIMREVLAAQKEVLTTMGPSNPLVGLGQLRHTLGKLLENAGIKDTSSFFNPLPINYQPPPPPPPPPEPAQILAQVEAQKIQADMAIDGAKLELERDKFLADVHLKAAELGVQLDMAALKASVEQNRIAVKAQ
jgi:hypothetical protein